MWFNLKSHDNNNFDYNCSYNLCVALSCARHVLSIWHIFILQFPQQPYEANTINSYFTDEETQECYNYPRSHSWPLAIFLQDLGFRIPRESVDLSYTAVWVLNGEWARSKRGSTRLMTWSRRTILIQSVCLGNVVAVCWWIGCEAKEKGRSQRWLLIFFAWGTGWIKTVTIICMQIFDRGILSVRIQRENTWFQNIFIHKCLDRNSTWLPWGGSWQHNTRRTNRSTHAEGKTLTIYWIRIHRTSPE